MPRPSHPEHKRKRYRLGFYVSDDDLRAMERASGIAGLAASVRGDLDRRLAPHISTEMAGFLRDHLKLALPKRVMPEVNQRALAELGSVGNNLNQLARRLNEAAKFSGDRGVLDEALALIADLDRDLAQLKRAVRALVPEADEGPGDPGQSGAAALEAATDLAIASLDQDPKNLPPLDW